MSLNNIQLKDLVVSELYRDNLLASDAEKDTGSRPHPASSTPATAQSPVTAPTTASSPAPATASVPPSPSGYKFLGNNQRKISIIVHAPGAPFLPDDQLSVLTRMLEACRMNMGDVAIVNHAAAPVSIGALKQQLQPAFVLLFGPTPRAIGLPMDFPVFKIQPYDQCTYLTAPSLEELARPGDEGKLLKSKLWVCLKALFEI
jgi:hypothetical protein